MASSSKLSYWFFRDVGFARKLSTGVYFAAKPWLVMGVAVYAGTHLLGYKMERTGHAVEDNHMDVVSLVFAPVSSYFNIFALQWAGYDSVDDSSEARPMFALKDGVSIPKQLADIERAEHRH